MQCVPSASRARHPLQPAYEPFLASARKCVWSESTVRPGKRPASSAAFHMALPCSPAEPRSLCHLRALRARDRGGGGRTKDARPMLAAFRPHQSIITACSADEYGFLLRPRPPPPEASAASATPPPSCGGGAWAGTSAKAAAASAALSLPKTSSPSSPTTKGPA